jgi:formylglycine-generating enzyme required for sulfatase activity
LLIGVSNYTAGWNPLSGVADDRQALYATLLRTGFDKVEVLSDPKTGEELLRGLKGFLTKYGAKENRLLVFFSGHGETLEEDEELAGYLVPASAPLSSLDREGFKRVAVSMGEILRIALAEDVAAKHLLFVFDSCFSGTIFSEMRGSAKVPYEIRAVTSEPVRQFIASGTRGQAVPDFSIFRRHFEAALAGAADLNRDGYIVGTELGIFLRGRVANDSQGAQTPQFSRMDEKGTQDVQGDFVFLSPLGVQAQGMPLASESDRTPAPESLAAGGSFTDNLADERDCAACPQLTVIPKPTKEFQMGSSLGEPGRNDEDEGPMLVQIASPFLISTYEITQLQWDACFSEGSCTTWTEGRSPRLPVTGVSWEGAKEYVQWLSEETGKTYRLPTEAEWEYAARAGVTTARPWGSGVAENQANCRGCRSQWDGASPAPVGSFSPNRFGLYDVLGNVWEWVEDCYEPDLTRRRRDGTAVTSRAPCDRVLRGGSYATTSNGVRLAARASYPQDRRSPNFGFRVVRELDSPRD